MLDSGNPLVSIVIPSFNRGKTLLSVSSVLQSSYPNIKLVVVDNASTDGSIDELKRLFAHDRLARIIIDTNNLGFSKGNNIGAHLCKGKYLVFLNQDTVVERLWLEPAASFLETRPSVGALQPKILRLTNLTRCALGMFVYDFP